MARHGGSDGRGGGNRCKQGRQRLDAGPVARVHAGVGGRPGADRQAAERGGLAKRDLPGSAGEQQWHAHAQGCGEHRARMHLRASGPMDGFGEICLFAQCPLP